MVGVSAPALATLASGCLILVVAAYSWPYRDRPGGWLWLGTLASMAVYTFSYGTGLLVFDPSLRVLFDYPRWVAANVAAPFFFAFALAYTGRERLIRSKPFGALVAVVVVLVGLVLTNPWHHLVWTDYRVATTLGAATVSYDRGPLLYLILAVSYSTLGLAVFFLFETVVSYGRAYRAQAAAIAITPLFVLPPTLATVFRIGPLARLDLVPVAFVPHLAADYWALFHTGGFEFAPATRRAAERTAIDDLGTAVAVCNEVGRIVTLNARAEELFDVRERDVFDRPIAEVAPDVDLEAGETTATFRVDGERRAFVVTPSPLSDSTGRQVGQTIAFQDVTEQRRRKQRLEVLNRVLRHNLRNDMSVVMGNAELIQATSENDDVERMAGDIVTESEGLVALGGKARTASDVFDADREFRPVALQNVARSVVDDAGEDGRVTVDVPADVDLVTDPELVRTALDVTVENAVEHGDGSVVVSADRENGAVDLRVADDGPGIPDHELETIRSRNETDLQHGSGLGLWILAWSVDRLGGELSFDVDDGTVVTVRLPDRPDDEGV